MQYRIDGSNISQSREKWIDCAKGIGIILVVVGHTYNIPTWLHSWIFAFHMPLFFLLSGYTMHISSNRTVAQQIKKYATAYLIPYILFALVNLVLETAWLMYTEELTAARISKYLAGILYCYANMEWMPNCTPLWFLVCIFLSKSLFLLIMKRCPQKMQFPCVLLCGCISYAIDQSGLPRLPWNSATAFMAVFFIWIGWNLRSHKIIDRLSSGIRAWVFWIVLLLLTPIFIRNGDWVGMNENTYGNLILFWLGAVGFSLAVMLLSRKISGCSFLSDFWGRNTIIVIAFNYYARFLSTELYYMIPVIRNSKLTWSVSFGITILTLACMIYARNCLNALRKKQIPVT